MSLFNRLIINGTYIYAARILEGLMQLAVLAFILSKIDRSYYAAALLILSVQAAIDLARGGMQKATLKYIAEYTAKGDQKAANGILSSSTALQAVVGVLGMIACIMIAPFVTSLFSLPEHMRVETQWATVLLGIGVATSFGLSPWHNSVAANERYDLLSLARTLGKLFRALMIVSLLMLTVPGLISIVLATIGGKIFERVLCLGFVNRICPHLKFSFKSITYRFFKVIIGFSSFDFFHTLSGLLYIQGSLYLATHLISLDAVADLGIIANITALTGMVMSQFAQMLVPVASRLQAQGENDRLSRIVDHGTKLVVFSGGIIMAGLVPWMDSFLNIWLGTDFVYLALPATVMISAAFLVNSLTCIHNSLGGVGKVGVDSISNTICTLIGLSIGTALIKILGFGLMGLVTGLFCARLLRVLFVSWYGAQVFDLTLGSFLIRGYFRTYILLSVIIIVQKYIGFSVSSWILLIVVGGITSCVFIFIGIYCILDRLDRIRLFNALKNGLNFLKLLFLNPAKQ